MSELSVAEANALDRAADMIARDGAWTQGALFRCAKGNPPGSGTGAPVCWCAVGAILAASNSEGRVSLSRALELAEKGLPETAPGSLRALSAWNDAPGRKQSEVVEHLRQAATLARQAPER